MELITVDEVHRYMHRSMTLADDRYIDAHRRVWPYDRRGHE